MSMEHRSYFADFVAFLTTVRGDLANITSPPFFLAPSSVVEVASCWTERPSLFVAPSLEADPQKRALLVLKWILGSLKSQYYLGGDGVAGIKKPLNAFLGELFFGHWSDETATSGIISEQVSHHPPVTASFMWNDEHGIRGEGYSRPVMSFTGYLNVKQFGHAMLHLDKYNEFYLIPFPDFKVKGFLSGHLYPELDGTYHIISSSGFVSELTFSGQRFFYGTRARNSFTAKLYRRDDPQKTAIYTASGQWNDRYTIRDAATAADLETCVIGSIPTSPCKETDPTEQDSWESQKAWKNVIEALKIGNMQDAVREKSKVEEAQRLMRKKEAADGVKWEPLFFTPLQAQYTEFEALASHTDWKLHSAKTAGVWKFDGEKAKHAKKPYHGMRTPLG